MAKPMAGSIAKRAGQPRGRVASGEDNEYRSMMDLRTVLIGGVVPAILLGASTVLMKLSLKNGIGIAGYLLVAGFTVAIYGLCALMFSGKSGITLTSGGCALAMGIAWSTAVVCIAYGFTALRLPVAVVAPLTNSNALVAVLLSAVILSEWKSVDYWKIIVGTIFIVIGATVVTTALSE